MEKNDKLGQRMKRITLYGMSPKEQYMSLPQEKQVTHAQGNNHHHDTRGQNSQRCAFPTHRCIKNKDTSITRKLSFQRPSMTIDAQ